MSDDALQDLPELLPARMLNEFTYCRRLFHLEWVGAEWRPSVDTIDGQHRHRRVDRPSGGSIAAAVGADPDSVRELTGLHLSDASLGLTAVLDRVVPDGDAWMPVDTKRGKLPPDGTPWPADRIQIGAQALLLRTAGFACDRAAVFYASSNRRIVIEVDDQLEHDVLGSLAAAKECAAQPIPPPPLDDSPKCARCSLHSICLPDETLRLIKGETGNPEPARHVQPPNADASPLYVQAQGARVSKSGERLVVTTKDGERSEVLLIDVSQVGVYGGVSMTPAAIHALMERSTPICHFSTGGWFYGVTHPIGSRNAQLRIDQVRTALVPERALELARGIVARKIENQRTLLRRNHRNRPQRALDAMKRLIVVAEEATDQESLLGVEGLAARHYFGEFGGMIRDEGKTASFSFEGRNRRPPRDPINALLSLAYSVLVKDWTIALYSVGLDPFIGVLHRPRFGRPSLALDLMEEFRPIVADSVVLQLLNNGELDSNAFIEMGGRCGLRPGGRKKFFAAYERRMGHQVTHPVFGYKVTYRQLLEIQARLFGRALTGEVADYEGFVVR